MTAGADYLDPYLRAVRRHGPSVQALLWASRQSQERRFAALARAYDFTGKRLLDAGCGCGDLLGYLQARGVRPSRYIGLEAVGELAEAARVRCGQHAQIVQCDFVREPLRLFAGADVVVFCGSLNTLCEADFAACIRHAHDAAGEAVVFNFLASPALAGAEYLTWHAPADVVEFARTFAADVKLLDGYIEGDATVLLSKRAAR